MTQKLPATFEKVRLYDMKNSQIQALRMFENSELITSFNTTPKVIPVKIEV